MLNKYHSDFTVYKVKINFSIVICKHLILRNYFAINTAFNYIYKSDWHHLQFHFFLTLWLIIFVASCEFNGLVSKSCRIPPAALYIYSNPEAGP
jgi:hypothetical protein